jgi:DNA invertase Pin-like site-specific DNA recombinase
MTYGYARVSTDRQDADRQELDIRRYAEAQGLGAVKLVRETVSSRKAEREVYKLVDKLRGGDVLIVTELSRLARSMIELNGIIADVLRKGASLRVVDGQAVDESIGSQSLVFALGIAAQVERDMISERTKSALRARKAQGVKLGRPAGKSKLDEKADEIRKYLALGVDKANIARIVGCQRATLYAWIKARGA